MALDLAIYFPNRFNYDPNSPSVRLRRINIRKPLRKLGVNCEIIYRKDELYAFDNILLSSCDRATYEEALHLKKLGKRLFFDHTEALWGLDAQVDIFNLCDYIVCCSTALAEFTRQRLTSEFTKCIVIPDMVEGPIPQHKVENKIAETVVWCGMGGNAYLARNLKPVLDKLDLKLVIISEHADADIKWNRSTYLEDISKYDIAICPQNVEKQPAKSAVKLATAMAVGMPTVSSPNPAYLELVKQGYNGFIAKSDSHDEWERALQLLKDPNVRKSISQNAIKTGSYFTQEEIAKKWLCTLLIKEPKIALINNTLPKKYISPGDRILDDLRINGYNVDSYKYEDVDILPKNYDAYLFVEVRYNPKHILGLKKKILFTQEDRNINFLPYFDIVLTTNEMLFRKWQLRGFVNVVYVPELNREIVDKCLELKDDHWLSQRKRHNKKLHDRTINELRELHKPELRWDGSNRDKLHIKFTNRFTGDNKKKILDIGSADGWLSLYLANNGHSVTALDFVDRGIDWVKQNNERLGLSVTQKFGFIEDLDTLFPAEKFDLILAYEILEHLDYRLLGWYLEKIEGLLTDSGSVLISLPKQDMNDNIEHLWSPDMDLIKNIFKDKPDINIEWVEIPNHGIEGNWFINYSKP